jgi:hypothetical protein
MKQIITFIFFIVSTYSYGEQIKSDPIKEALITRQVVSSRCEGLIKDHIYYLKARQKVHTLIDINHKLRAKNTKNSLEVSIKLKRSHNLLLREIDHLDNTLTSLEEQIVSLGCPGITL